jgi:hypothetical protein
MSSLSSHDALAVSSPASGTALGAEASAAGEEPKVHAKPPTFMDVLRYKVSRAPYVGELATKVRACVGERVGVGGCAWWAHVGKARGCRTGSTDAGAGAAGG